MRSNRLWKKSLICLLITAVLMSVAGCGGKKAEVKEDDKQKTEETAPAVKDQADELLVIPNTHRLLQPVLAVIPLQLFAYYVALNRGCDIDKPRNLAKSVTVE